MRTTQLYKAVLLAALGLSTVTAAQASGDLLLGFNDAAGPSGAQNDYVIDLGAVSQFTTGTLVNFAIAGSTTFQTAFSADVNYLNNVAAGVVGGATGSLFLTSVGAPYSGLNSASASTSSSLAQSPTVGEYTSATVGGWSYNVATAPSQVSVGGPFNPGSSPSGSVAGTSGSNPMANLSGGVLSINLYEATYTGGFHSTFNNFTQIGTFVINPGQNSGYFQGVDAVPEPSSLALFGGAGVLGLLFRRKLNRKNA